MKVGTDGVLLGAWCRVIPRQDKAILDIGTGTGVIALQLAQRTEGSNTRIEAVETDPAACGAARRNFEASEWSERLVMHPPMTVQEFARVAARGAVAHEKFDHIVSNPPYFVDSLSSPDPARSTARHTSSLPYEDFISVCDKLLDPHGRVSLILPAGSETSKMITVAGAVGFVVSRRTEVHSTQKSGPKRTLLEFSRHDATVDSDAGSTSLVIQNAGPGTFSEEYRSLTRDFYLYF